MKIIHLIDSLKSGGKERQFVETLKFLSQHNGITCDVVVMSENIHYGYVKDLDIKIHQLIRKYKNDPSMFLKIYKLFKALQPDIIHSWNSMCSVYAVPAVKLLGIRLVNNFLRNAPMNLGLNDKNWLRAKLTFPFSDVIAANSYAGLKSYQVPAHKGVCLHNGFDFSRTKQLVDKDTIRQMFDIGSKYVVGMVATFSKKKDHKTFIDAAQIVLEKREDVTFVAIGDGEYFTETKKQIRPEYRDRFILPGTQKRVMNIVNIFDIGILLTNIHNHGEGIPNAVMEYMALKKPVIVSDCGGIRELVEDQKTGFIMKVNNPGHIAKKISLLLDSKPLATELGQNGYEKLLKEFSLDVMGNEFLRLYKSLGN